MLLLVTAAVMVGAFGFTLVLFVFGYRTHAVETGVRLSRLKGQAMTDDRDSTKNAGIGLRRRASVSLGGINLVSTRLAGQWAAQLEQAGLTLTVKEYFILRIVVSLGIGTAVAMAQPFPWIGILVAPIGFAGVGAWIKRRAVSRRKKLESQLVELLQMLASGLRAGFGLSQALESAVEQIPAPLSIEIRRTLRDTAVGASLEQALEALNDRVDSGDFDIVITAIMIQRAVGGNLAEILDTVAHTMRERERIRGEIQTLTSQQRLTGFVIAGIPVALALYFIVVSPDYIAPLITDSLGRMLLGAAVVMEVVGFLIIRKIVDIEV